MNPLSWNVGHFFSTGFHGERMSEYLNVLSVYLLCLSLDNGYYLFHCVFLLKRVFSNLKKKVFYKVDGWPAV